MTDSVFAAERSPVPELPRVDMREIRKSYGALDVLRGVDLQIAPGEVIGLVGDNGAGKSTLMKMLSGAETPDSGQIR